MTLIQDSHQWKLTKSNSSWSGKGIKSSLKTSLKMQWNPEGSHPCFSTRYITMARFTFFVLALCNGDLPNWPGHPGLHFLSSIRYIRVSCCQAHLFSHVFDENQCSPHLTNSRTVLVHIHAEGRCQCSVQLVCIAIRLIFITQCTYCTCNHTITKFLPTPFAA